MFKIELLIQLLHDFNVVKHWLNPFHFIDGCSTVLQSLLVKVILLEHGCYIIYYYYMLSILLSIIYYTKCWLFYVFIYAYVIIIIMLCLLTITAIIACIFIIGLFNLMATSLYSLNPFYTVEFLYFNRGYNVVLIP